MSNFSFSHSVFKRLFLQTCENPGLFGKRLILFNPFLHNPWILRVCHASLLKTLWKKEKLLISTNFSLSHSVFHHIGASSQFHQIWNCCLGTHSVWKSLKFIIWERVNPFPHNDTFWCPWETSLLKTQWEKEKLLVTSNFSFSHNVFYLFA